MIVTVSCLDLIRTHLAEGEAPRVSVILRRGKPWIRVCGCLSSLDLRETICWGSPFRG